jgi:hypothetical protein
MLSELHSLNLKLYSIQYNKKFVLHLIVVPQLTSGQRHNYSTKIRQAGQANEQSMYYLMSMVSTNTMKVRTLWYTILKTRKKFPVTKHSSLLWFGVDEKEKKLFCHLDVAHFSGVLVAETDRINRSGHLRSSVRFSGHLGQML